MSTPFWRSGAVEEPEGSVALRGAVLSTVLVASAAVIVEGLVGPAALAAALLGIPAGFFLSHRRRHHESAVLKLGIAIALTAALYGFVGQLRSAQIVSALDVQIPLAELFLWVQFLHALHLPSRRDLMFSLAASLVMLAVAGVLSVGMTVGVFIVLWAGGALLSLFLAYRSRLLATSGDVDERAVPLRRVLGPGAAVVGAALVVFLIAPAASPIAPIAFPTELAILSRLTEPGGFSNPSLGPSGSGRGDLSGRASFGYFGFAESLDTSLRGRPDDSPVMQVRAPAPAFWRGQTFDVWDGRTWTSSSTDAVPISSAGAIQALATLGDDRPAGAPGSDRFVQTFYIDRPGPNLIFGAYRIDEVFFTERTLFELDDGTLRTGVNLAGGSIYTVVSWRSRVDEDILRSSDPLRLDYAEEIRTRYLQLPRVPQRVLGLAREVTADAPTTYDKVRALESWMANNTTYSLDIPRLPEGADAVDQFLFVDRRGFCEQIGSSLVVMLRSLGIPARLVVGYTPGDRNPFTGLYEVKASDAHSWAEVYFPGIGWQGFDPTASVPLYDGAATGTAGSGLFGFLASRFGELPAGAGTALRVGGISAAAAVIGVLTVTWIADRRRKRRRTWAEATMAAFEELGSRRGAIRAPSDTALEYLESLEAAGIRGAAEAGVLVTDVAYGSRSIDRAGEDHVRRVLETHRR